MKSVHTTLARIGDICSAQTSSIKQKDLVPVAEGGCPVFGASGFICNIASFKQEQPCIGLVKDGAGVGRVMPLPARSSIIGTMLYVIPGVELENAYLYYLLTSLHLDELHSGATIPHVYFKDFKDKTVPLSPLPVQRRIAAELDKIVAAKRQAECVLAKFDTLVKAKFVEMFGDVGRNAKSWPMVPLSKVVNKIGNGKSFVCESYPREGDWPAILKLSAATWGVYKPEENKALKPGSQFCPECEVKAGDLLFTRKNTIDLVGMCAYVWQTPPKLMLPDLIFRLETNGDVERVFLAALVNCDLFRANVRALANGSAGSMPNISKMRLMKLEVPLPPLALQQQFAEFVKRTDAAKATARKLVDKLDMLYRAKLQEYFA